MGRRRAGGPAARVPLVLPHTPPLATLHGYTTRASSAVFDADEPTSQPGLDVAAEHCHCIASSSMHPVIHSTAGRCSQCIHRRYMHAQKLHTGRSIPGRARVSVLSSVSDGCGTVPNERGSRTTRRRPLSISRRTWPSPTGYVHYSLLCPLDQATALVIVLSCGPAIASWVLLLGTYLTRLHNISPTNPRLESIILTNQVSKLSIIHSCTNRQVMY